jgi:hypothetical protein
MNMSKPSSLPHRGAWLLSAAALAASSASGQVATFPTMDPDVLAKALNPMGLSINDVFIVAGVDGQFGTFNNFELRPVTIRPGLVLSSGNIADLRPIPGATDPDYDPGSPPPQVNSQMTPEPATGGTPEFNTFGFTAGNIENFNGSYDVAAVRINFTINNDSPIKFDFIFGSVEFPFWTSQFTDSFLVFLDGTAPENQITFDAAGNAVQVGSSFADLETIGDLNTAFSNPHALIHHLTTTTARLDAGEHFLIFEVGDVNDHVLDSVVFITNLRAEEGDEGTEPSEDPAYEGCPNILMHPDSVLSCRGATVSFSVTAHGNDPLTFQWLKNGDPIDTEATPSAATPTLVLTNIQPSDVAEYECDVTNDCDTETSDPAELTFCLADFNCDGLANSQDFFDFLTAFFAVAPDADFNQDGIINSQDFFDFLTAFFEGC